VGQVLQQCGVAAPQPPPLRREPAVEGGAAGDFQAFQEVPFEEPDQLALPVRGQRLDALGGRARDLDRIDEAIREVEPDRVAVGMDAPPAGRVEDAPQLAEALAQLTPRVVGHVPQELAQLAPRGREGRQGEVGEQGAHLAGRGEREGAAVATHRQGPEQPDVEVRRAAGTAA
jgi:hypothetical protein